MLNQSELYFLSCILWCKKYSTELNSFLKLLLPNSVIGVEKHWLGIKSSKLWNHLLPILLKFRNSIPYLNRGLSHSNLGDEYAAISDYNKAIALDSQYLKAYYNRAWSKKEIGDIQGSIADYTKVIDLNPRYYKAYVNRGIIRSDLGDKRAACKDYKQSISLGDTETANWLKGDNAKWCREMIF